MALLPEAAQLSTTPSASIRSRINFPKGFLWGVATAAHQVEGGNLNNQWSLWEAAGKIKSEEPCGVACDWWNNAERDFDLAREMGLNALRLSVEWSRIEPEPGQWNLPALRRYREMLEGLLDRGLQPFVSLHHFTHPQWFERRGAFLDEMAAQHFEDFALRVVAELGDLCHHWVTFNEPNVFAALGYVLGEFPPGRKGHIRTALRVLNAMALCHARAYHAIHDIQPEAQVGWAQNYVVFQPANPAFPLDRWSASFLSHLFNESFLTIIERGRPILPINLMKGRLAALAGACDFVGLNVYSRFHVAFSMKHLSQLFSNVYVPEHVPQGDSGVEKPYGEAYPAGITAAVKRTARIGKPIYILENGVPDAEDRIRPWLIVNAVHELSRLIEQGHDIRGYFHWTLTDNFEWSEGWHLKFGLVALDTSTQRRTMRNSGRLYGAIARANGLTREMTDSFRIPTPNPAG
jgi:beta-glucosidase